jgi:hypothetical protein
MIILPPTSLGRAQRTNGSGGSLADDSDGDTLVGGESELMAQTATPQTVCYRDINLFL